LEGGLPLDDEGRTFLNGVVRYQTFNGDGDLGLGVLLGYRLGEKVLARLSWGKSSRPPGFYELYGDGASILPNPSLRWEELEEVELGLSLQGRVGVELSLFRRDYDEVIELVQANPRFSVHQNLGAASVEGAELSIGFRVGEVLVEGVYTCMDARSERAGASRGMRLPNRPQSCGSLRASWGSGRLFIFAEANFTSGWFLDAMERVPYEDALVEVLSRRLSAYRGYPLRDFLELASRERDLLLGDLNWKIEALSLVARSAPLLGLLGTVLGMISLFRRLPEAGPGDVALLSSGIWEAVLTTAFGLAVAVPALAAEHALEGMTRRLEAGLERACLEMLKGGDGGA